LATGRFDSTIKLWSFDRLTCIHEIERAHEDSFNCFEMIDNKTLVSGGED
jgi:WD40 repeat protein